MVVGNDKLDPKSFCRQRLFNACDPIVDCNDQFRTVTCQLFDGTVVKSVTFFQSVWHIIVGVRVEQHEASHQDGGRCHTVGVIVTIDGDLFARLDRIVNQLRCLFNTGQLTGVSQVHQVCRQEIFGIRDIGDTTMNQKFSDDAGDARRSFQLLDGLMVARAYSPPLAHVTPFT